MHNRGPLALLISSSLTVKKKVHACSMPLWWADTYMHSVLSCIQFRTKTKVEDTVLGSGEARSRLPQIEKVILDACLIEI